MHDTYVPETKVVPGNGPVTDMSAIQWNVDYLTAVETEVRAAISDGLSLEENVAKVQLPEFQGYSLFSWVHPGLNVPAAYKYLK